MQKQGLLIWKHYVLKMGFDLHMDEEDNQIADVTAEKVFLKKEDTIKTVPNIIVEP